MCPVVSLNTALVLTITFMLKQTSLYLPPNSCVLVLLFLSLSSLFMFCHYRLANTQVVDKNIPINNIQLIKVTQVSS